MKDNKPKTGLYALFIKLGSKFLGVFAKLLKGLKFTKIGLAALSLAGYSAVYSWKFALLLMIAVGFHESGHVWAMKRMGIKTKGFYFLPFVGGAAIAEENCKTYSQTAYIAIMGPVWGTLMAWGAGLLYWFTGAPMWAAAAAWMSTINLFNLLPISPLDGGHLLRSIGFSIHEKVGIIFLILSIFLAGIVLLHFKIGLFVLFLVIGSIELLIELNYRFKGRVFNYNKYPTSMNKIQLTYTVLSYVGTVSVLVILLFLMKNVQGADLAANFLE